MKRLFLFSIISIYCLISCTNNNESAIIDLRSEYLKLSISGKGTIIDFIDLKTNKNYLAKDTSVFLMSLRINNEI
jgi:hypothetical protein